MSELEEHWRAIIERAHAQGGRSADLGQHPVVAVC